MIDRVLVIALIGGKNCRVIEFELKSVTVVNLPKHSISCDCHLLELNLKYL